VQVQTTGNCPIRPAEKAIPFKRREFGGSIPRSQRTSIMANSLVDEEEAARDMPDLGHI
jgi:hypothetical protein